MLSSGECRKIRDCCIFHVNDLEASIAEEWYSPGLMSALRSENLLGDLTEKRSEIIRQIKAQVVGYLRSGTFNSRRLADIEITSG